MSDCFIHRLYFFIAAQTYLNYPTHLNSIDWVAIKKYSLI